MNLLDINHFSKTRREALERRSLKKYFKYSKYYAKWQVK